MMVGELGLLLSDFGSLTPEFHRIRLRDGAATLHHSSIQLFPRLRSECGMMPDCWSGETSEVWR